jgi:hypothetical protein
MTRNSRVALASPIDMVQPVHNTDREESLQAWTKTSFSPLSGEMKLRFHPRQKPN